MINLYNKETTNFDNNGIANLKDMITCVISEELNGNYQLEAEYPLKSENSNLIENESVLKVDAGYDSMQLFRIKRNVPNLQTIKISANHISYDLKDNNLLDVYPQKLSGAAALEWILSKTQYEHNFTSFSDITDIGTARYINKNPIRALIGDDDNSFIKVWGGEIVRDNFTIKILKKRGNDLGYKLSKTKNITGLEFDIDDSNVITRVIPKAYNDIELPEVYIDSPLIDTYPHPIIQEKEYSNIKLNDENSSENDGYDTLEEVYAALSEAVSNDFNINDIDKPVISVKVNFIELSKTTEYQKFKNLETLNLGDYVTLNFEQYSVKLRVIKTKYDAILGRYIELELGEAKATFFDSISKKIEDLKTKIVKVELPSFLEKAKNNATDQLTKALGGTVYKTENELYIMDSAIPEQAVKIWRWNLNGLGYSKTGINGPYELAMTQDGQIVADFIKTGTIDTALIEGYDMLVTTVKSLSDNEEEQNKKISQISQTVDSVQNLFQITGGINLIKNSVGLFSDNFWIKSETGTFEFGEDSDLIGKTTSASKISIKNGILISSSSNIGGLTLDTLKSFNFKIKQDEDVTTTVTLYGLSELHPFYKKTFIGLMELQDIYTEDECKFFIDNSEITLKIESSSVYDGQVQISDLMLNDGDKQQWQPASSEIWGTVVKLSQLGLSIYALEGNYVTMMTTDGFMTKELNGNTIGDIINKLTRNGLFTKDIEQTGKHIQVDLVHDIINSNNQKVYIEYIKD